MKGSHTDYHFNLTISSNHHIIRLSSRRDLARIDVKKIDILTGDSVTLASPALTGPAKRRNGRARHYCSRVLHGDTLYLSYLSDDQDIKTWMVNNGFQHTVWEYSISRNSWKALEHLVFDGHHQGLALVGGEITFFGMKGVQMLRNGEAWEHVVYQPEGTLAGSPAVLVLP